MPKLKHNLYSYCKLLFNVIFQNHEEHCANVVDYTFSTNLRYSKKLKEQYVWSLPLSRNSNRPRDSFHARIL